MSRSESEIDLNAQRRAYQTHQSNVQTQQRDPRHIFSPRYTRSPRENEHPMSLRPLKPQPTVSSEQDTRDNRTQRDHSLLTGREIVKQRGLNQRIQLRELGEQLILVRYELAAERGKNEHLMQLKDEELRRRHLEISDLRVSIVSYTRQKLILLPQQDLKDSDIAFKYQNLCTAIADWEEVEFGDLENPLENFGKIAFGPAAAGLVQTYLHIENEAKIADTHQFTGKITLTYMIHLQLQQTSLLENICWPSLDPSIENFVSFIEHGIRTIQPPRGMITPLRCPL